MPASALYHIKGRFMILCQWLDSWFLAIRQLLLQFAGSQNLSRAGPGVCFLLV